MTRLTQAGFQLVAALLTLGFAIAGLWWPFAWLGLVAVIAAVPFVDARFTRRIAQRCR